MVYETEKFKARIIEKFGTCQAFAEAINIDKSTLSKYLSRGRGLRGETLIKAVRALEIPDDQIDAYFFTPRVVKNQPRKKATA